MKTKSENKFTKNELLFIRSMLLDIRMKHGYSWFDKGKHTLLIMGEVVNQEWTVEKVNFENLERKIAKLLYGKEHHEA